MSFFNPVFTAVWQIMSIQMTFGQFTITLGQVFLLSFIADAAIIGIYYYLFGR